VFERWHQMQPARRTQAFAHAATTANIVKNIYDTRRRRAPEVLPPSLALNSSDVTAAVQPLIGLLRQKLMAWRD